MSDQELRQVLRDVITDIDTGRVVPRRGGRLKAVVAGAALAAGLALTGCGKPVYGVPTVDARPDTGATDAYGIPLMDTGVTDAYGIPLMDTGVSTDATVDAGPTEDYGAPDVDAGPVDAGPSTDDGGVFLYGVPPLPDDDE